MDIVDKILDGEIPPGAADGSVMGSEELRQQVDEKDLDDLFVVQTSGSGGDPKQVPFTYSELDRQRDIPADGFKLGGLKEHHTVLDLGAPLPHFSGWVIREGSRRAGAEAINRTFQDYPDVIEWREAPEVDAVITLPQVAVSVGEEIEGEYGHPAELFSEPEIGLMSGDIVTDGVRDRLKELWGFSEVVEFYSAVDGNVMASAVDESRRMVPLTNHYVFEIIPDHEQNEIYDIRELEEETAGSILITDPDREAIDFHRYRIGDKVRVYPEEDIPRVEVLGKEGETVNLAGVLLYPKQIEGAVEDTYGREVSDWVAEVSRPETKPAVDFYIAGDVAEDRETEFRYHLFERNTPLREAYEEVEVIDRLNVRTVSSTEEMPVERGEGIKSARIVFDESYTQ